MWESGAVNKMERIKEDIQIEAYNIETEREKTAKKQQIFKAK